MKFVDVVSEREPRDLNLRSHDGAFLPPRPVSVP